MMDEISKDQKIKNVIRSLLERRKREILIVVDWFIIINIINRIKQYPSSMDKWSGQ